MADGPISNSCTFNGSNGVVGAYSGWPRQFGNPL